MVVGKILLTPFVLLVASIWLVVGLAFYVPLIAKAVTLFTLQLLLAAITQRQTTAGDGLQRALRFYPNGFVIIFNSLNFDGKSAGGEEYTRGFFGPLIDGLRAIFLALVFWATTLLFFHHLGVWKIGMIDRYEAELLSHLGIRAAPLPPRTGPGDLQFSSVVRPANLRSGPGTEHPTVATLTPEQRLQILDDPDTTDNWVPVRTADGAEGFVALTLLETASSP